jgi:hypothetical protein
MRALRLSAALSSASGWLFSAAVLAPVSATAQETAVELPAPHSQVAWGECLATVETEGALVEAAAEPLPTYCPMIWYECLSRDTLRDLERAGATTWELMAVRAITRDGESKGPVDLVMTDCGAHGWAHFSPERLDLNLSHVTECPYDDPEWRHAVLAVLYSERSGALTLAAWRRIIAPALYEAQRHGWRRAELALAAAVANTAPTLLVRLGEECSWSSACVAHRYARGNEHRARRITWLTGVAERRAFQ